jgi:hypothetical protein
MAILDTLGRPRKTSRMRGKRFLTALDMAEVKHLTAIHNAKIKRGEVQQKARMGVCQCGCGRETCLFVYEAAPWTNWRTGKPEYITF